MLPIRLQTFAIWQKRDFMRIKFSWSDIFVAQGGCPNGTGAGVNTIQCETQGGNQYHDKGVGMAHGIHRRFSIFYCAYSSSNCSS